MACKMTHPGFLETNWPKDCPKLGQKVLKWDRRRPFCTYFNRVKREGILLRYNKQCSKLTGSLKIRD